MDPTAISMLAGMLALALENANLRHNLAQTASRAFQDQATAGVLGPVLGRPGALVLAPKYFENRRS